LLVGGLPMFDERDAPDFGRKGLRIYAGVFVVFFLVFAGMWTSQIMQVINTGDLSGNAYSSAPVVFWTIRYLDLGFSIPLGLLALFLLLTKPRRAYSLVLLFFGFGMTTGTAVNTVAVVEVINHDPSVSRAAASGLVVFPILGTLVHAGFFYLIRDKLHRRRPRLEASAMQPRLPKLEGQRRDRSCDVVPVMLPGSDGVAPSG
jgi:hypothetical protein